MLVHLISGRVELLNVGLIATVLHRQEIRITVRRTMKIATALLHEAVILAEAAVALVRRIAAVAVHVPRVAEVAVAVAAEDDASYVSGRMNY